MLKRNSDIADLFRKHEANKVVCSSRPVVVDSAPHAPPIESDSEAEMEDAAAPNPQSTQQTYDHQFLPHDPGQRIPISEYDVNEQDDVRRGYIKAGPCQPFAHNFPTRKINGKNRHFSFVWFTTYSWLEYSIAKDAAFCFVCYLFKGRSNGSPGGGAFVKDGFRDWKRPK